MILYIFPTFDSCIRALFAYLDWAGGFCIYDGV